MNERLIETMAEKLATSEYGLSYWCSAPEELREAWRDVARRFMWAKRQKNNPLSLPRVQYRPEQIVSSDDLGAGDGQSYQYPDELDHPIRPERRSRIGRGILSSRSPGT